MIVDVLGGCRFPNQGAAPLCKAWGITVPAFMLPVYIWFIGGQAWLCHRVLSSGISRAQFLRLYGLFTLVNIVLEAPAIMLGMYAYYGPQPFVVFGFPAWWASATP